MFKRVLNVRQDGSFGNHDDRYSLVKVCVIDAEVSLIVVGNQIDSKNILTRKFRIGFIAIFLNRNAKRTYGHHRYTYMNLLVLTFS